MKSSRSTVYISLGYAVTDVPVVLIHDGEETNEYIGVGSIIED